MEPFEILMKMLSDQFSKFCNEYFYKSDGFQPFVEIFQQISTKFQKYWKTESALKIIFVIFFHELEAVQENEWHCQQNHFHSRWLIYATKFLSAYSS